MRRLRGLRIFLTTVAAFGVMAGFAISAENTPPTFQASPDDFLDVLKQPAQTKRLKTKGLKAVKGPGAIVEDYKKLTENPTARSLILFDFDSDRIKPESYPILENLATTLLEQLPDIQLVVAGHTDNIGSDEYNLTLSQRRAEAVKRFLSERCAIRSDRLLTHGYGEQQPLSDNADAEMRAQNRRVEFIRIE